MLVGGAQDGDREPLLVALRGEGGDEELQRGRPWSTSARRRTSGRQEASSVGHPRARVLLGLEVQGLGELELLRRVTLLGGHQTK